MKIVHRICFMDLDGSQWVLEDCLSNLPDSSVKLLDGSWKLEAIKTLMQ